MGDRDSQMQWTRENTLKLIKLYKCRPILWDTSLPEHRDKNICLYKMEQIADACNVSVADVKQKIQNLRSLYKQEARRLRAKEDVSDWEFFQSLSFLNRRKQPTAKSRAALDMPVLHLGCPLAIKNNCAEKARSPVVITEVRREKQSCGHRLDNERATGRNRPEQNGSISKHQFDDYQTFGDFVAAELRGLSCTYKQNDLKQMILRNILTVTDSSYISPSVSPSLPKYSNGRDEQGGPSLFSIISIESINDLKNEH